MLEFVEHCNEILKMTFAIGTQHPSSRLSRKLQNVFSIIGLQPEAEISCHPLTLSKQHRSGGDRLALDIKCSDSKL
jgi:hypothetical protein